jgi:serine/threonine protein kinase
VIKVSNRLKSDADRNLYLNEYQNLKKLEHPNIIRVFEACLFEDVFEYADSGDLSQLIGKDREEAEIIRISSQIIEGLRYLHSQNIIHRDLKPQNVLMFQDGTVKIADFGLSQSIKNDLTTMNTIAGTICFMAPEMMNPEENQIGKVSDIWSLGVCLYNLIEGKFPFPERESSELYNSIMLKDPFPFQKNILLSLKRIIFWMLKVKQNFRPTIDQISNSKIFQGGASFSNVSLQYQSNMSFQSVLG